MMRKRFIQVLLAVLLLLVVGAWFGKSALYRFLAPTERTEARMLIVEGWISEGALRQVVEEVQRYPYDQILVSSIAYDSAFRVYSTGGLIFRIADALDSASIFHTLGVHAFGTPAEGIQAHAQVYADTIRVGEFTAADDPFWYHFSLPDTLRLDSILIQYDNNLLEVNAREDRDLYVYSIRLDSLWFPVRHPKVYYDRLKIDGKDVFYTDYESAAEEARDFLVAQGVNRTKVRTLTAPRVAYERTYTAALAVQHYLDDSVTAINVFSEATHSRRSRLVYQKTLGDLVEVGIIAAGSNEYNAENWWRSSGSRNYVLMQLIKYLYTNYLFYPSLTETVKEEVNKN